MNKKNIVLAMGLMVFGTALVLPMSDSEKRAIRKELYSNYENNRINAFTLAENGLDLSEVIDRDIRVLSKHKYLLQNKISFCKNSVKTDLFLGGILGGTAFSAGRTCGDVFCKIKEIKDDYLSGKTGNWVVDKIGYNILSTERYQEFIEENVGVIVRQDPTMNHLLDITIITAFIAGVAGLMFVGKLLYVGGYARTLYAYLQKAQKSLERDQAIIAQLEEIKQTIEH